MGVETAISWCHHTFNPWIGCQRVSPGCEHCYAEAYDKRVGGVPVDQRDPNGNGKAELRWGPTARRTRTSLNYWRQPLKWNAAALAAGERRRVFCASLADVFEDHDSIERTWRLELFSLIRQTPSLDWLLLTKRPQNFRQSLGAALFASARHNGYMASEEAFEATRLWILQWLDGRPPANVWLGTTVEDQKRADERIPVLLSVPAAVRFLSCEPLLERIDLEFGRYNRPGLLWKTCPTCNGTMSVPVAGGGAPCATCLDHQGVVNSGIDWVIAGGESGAGARPFATDWVIDLVAQCRSTGARPFVKQLGARPVDAVGAPLRLLDHSGSDWAEWPAALRVREYPEALR